MNMMVLAGVIVAAVIGCIVAVKFGTQKDKA